MQELYATLLSWTMLLMGETGVPPPLPEIVYVWPEFFHERACHHQPCKVIGWYSGGGTVYFDIRLREILRDPHHQANSFAASVVVHEFVHWRQRAAGRYSVICDQVIDLERQAYNVQRRFLLAHSDLDHRSVGRMVMHTAHCEGELSPADAQLYPSVF